MHRKTPVMIFVVGTSGSGKTTTIEYLTAHLTELGFHVGVVKHIHEGGLTLDTQGKDTWRHARAGADVVVGVGSREQIAFKKTSNENRLDTVLTSLRTEPLDVLFLEGFSADSTKHSYKIVTARNAVDLKRTLSKTAPPILAITGHAARTSSGKLSALELPSQGAMLTAMVRRLVRPSELRRSFLRASKYHGGKCVGLAVGLRASYLASNILGDLSSSVGIFGTKRCVVEAFRCMYPKLRAKVQNRRNDSITIRKNDVALRIQLTPKKEYSRPEQVLDLPDDELFESVETIHPD
jgi:molybdopterin-guanine dinucleotide biosynthesis protein MobB